MKMADLTSIYPILLLVAVSTKLSGGQQLGGDHVCYHTKKSFAGMQYFRAACGWRWGLMKCPKLRYVTVYKHTKIPYCCPGWGVTGSNSKHCDKPVCFDSAPGVCPFGGECLSPNKCWCRKGYALPDCQDIDECNSGDHGCSHVCENTVGSFLCTCGPGYDLLDDKRTCAPTCFELEVPGECLNHQKCVLPDECDCSPGYRQPECEDIDECTEYVCGQVCVNIPGSYKCSCRAGYELQVDGKSCEPVCPSGPHGVCPFGGYCESPGVCHCEPGYRPPFCADIDDCLENVKCEQTCENAIGRYTCGCYHGYTLHSDGSTCTDDDECVVDNGGCSDECVNLPGSFSCDCPVGASLLPNGKTCAGQCDDNWELGECPNGGTCLTSVSCSCRPGFTGNKCDNVDECAVRNGGCSHICLDNHGSFTCDCPDGYQVTRGKQCRDINECDGDSGCMDICVNEIGSYHCLCRPGRNLTADGVSCQDNDECATDSPCPQICVNTDGSYRCECDPGFSLSPDGRACNKIHLCEDGDVPGCLQLCARTSDGTCKCPDGSWPHSDKLHCVEPCWNTPCQHGGQCESDGLAKVSCDCTGTGYHGEYCQLGTLSIPSYMEVKKGDKDKRLTSFTIDVISEIDSVIRVSPGQHIAVFPNPIFIKSSVNATSVSLIAMESGLFNVTFKVTNEQIEPKVHSMLVNVTDVFVRHHLLLRTLIPGCFTLDLAEHGLDHVFTSTRRWYKLLSRNTTQTYFTVGITYYISKVPLPLSIDGLSVLYGTTVSIGPLTGRMTENGSAVAHSHPQDVHCTEVSLSEVDLDDFRRSSSLLRSLVQAAKSQIPHWYQLSVRQTYYSQFYKAFILPGSLLKDDICAMELADDDRWYAVFRFTNPFDMRLTGQNFDFREAHQSAPYCFVIDFKNTDTFWLSVNTDSSHLLRTVTFMEKMFKVGFKMWIRTFGIGSGWDLSYSDDLVFFNGAGMFQYPDFGKLRVASSVYISKPHFNSIKNIPIDFTVETIAKIYSDANTPNIFTHIHTDAKNFFLYFEKLRMTVQLKLLGKMFKITFRNILKDDRAIIGNGGDGDERKACGLRANPPGIFAQARVSGGIIPDDFLLFRPLISIETEVYFYMTFPDKADKNTGWNEEQVISLMDGVARRSAPFVRYLRRISGKNKANWRSEYVNKMLRKLTEMTTAASQFDVKNITKMNFADLTETLLKCTTSIRHQLEEFESELQLEFDPLIIATMSSMSRAFSLVEGHISTVWWVMFDGSVPYFPKEDYHGLKGEVRFTVLYYELLIDMEFVTSPHKLMFCSDLHQYFDHIQGERLTRAKGVVLVGNGFSAGPKFKWVPLLWRFLQVRKGGGIEIALAQNKPLFALRLQIVWSVFGIKLAGYLIVTNKEIAAVVEANIYDTFRTRLTLGAAVPTSLSELSIWLTGEFLPGGDHDMESSLWSAVRRVIQTSHKAAQKRLSCAQQKMVRIQETMTASQENIATATRDLDNKQQAFDEAVQKLEKAKAELEKAKESIRKADGQLKAAQAGLDSLCKRQDCSKSCQKTLETAACRSGRSPKSACVVTKPCGVSLKKIGCVLKNVGCSIVRGVTYGAIAVARASLYIPLVALDAAKATVSLAQVIVDKSRFLLDVAKGLSKMAVYAIEGLKKTMHLFVKAVDVLKKSLKAVFLMFDSLVANVLQKFIDIKQCGFRLELSVRNWFVISAHCEINFMSSGWKKFEFVLNFKDLFGSMSGAAKSAVNTAQQHVDHQRQKRDLNLEQINSTTTNTREQLDWTKRCELYKPLQRYINQTLYRLRKVSTEIIDNANEAEINAYIDNSNITEVQMTLEDLAIDAQVGIDEFGLTRGVLDDALAMGLVNNEELLAEKEFTDMVNEHNSNVTSAARNTLILDQWQTEMEGVDFFGDCLNLMDCIFWTFGELDFLVDSLDPFLVKPYLNEIEELRTVFEDLLLNESKTVKEILEMNIDLSVFDDLNGIFCGTLPEVFECPGDATAHWHESAEFHCRAVATPEPVYYWFHQDNLVAFGKNLSVLELNDIKSINNGSYCCVVGNHIGNSTAACASLLVVHSPMITPEMTSPLQLRLSKVFSLSSSVVGVPTPSIRWYICSSIACETVESESLFGISEMSVIHGREFLCRYEGTNDYGKVTSAEILIQPFLFQPAFPFCVLNVGFLATGAMYGHENVADSNITVNDTLSELFRSELIKRLVGKLKQVNITFVSIKPTDNTLVVELASRRHFGNNVNESSVNETMNDIIKDMRKTTRRLWESIQVQNEAFNHDGVLYQWNPAYFKVERPRFECPEGWDHTSLYMCERSPEPLVLPAPSRLSQAQTRGNVRIQWMAPFYAQYFVTDYSLLIESHNGSTLNINTSSTGTSFTFPVTWCGDRCDVSVRALTATRHSQWVSLTFDRDPDRPQYIGAGVYGRPYWPRAIYIPIAVVCSLVFVGLSFAVVAVYRHRRAGEITAASPR